uniref:Uncharacterized protein n=1 Tax=Setaria viridis TaxID=4556 RepID=A0A4U6UWX0_SETVI|nr:hypothetical protein SEVIR_4G184601v2 [Setaria viridis]
MRRGPSTCAAAALACDDGLDAARMTLDLSALAPPTSPMVSLSARRAAASGPFSIFLAEGWILFASLGMRSLSVLLRWSAMLDFCSGRRRRRSSFPLPFPLPSSMCRRPMFVQRS